MTKDKLVKLIEEIINEKTKYNYPIEQKAKLLPRHLSSLKQTADRLSKKDSFSYNDEAIITKMFDSLVDIMHEIARVNM